MSCTAARGNDLASVKRHDLAVGDDGNTAFEQVTLDRVLLSGELQQARSLGVGRHQGNLEPIGAKLFGNDAAHVVTFVIVDDDRTRQLGAPHDVVRRIDRRSVMPGERLSKGPGNPVPVPPAPRRDHNILEIRLGEHRPPSSGFPDRSRHSPSSQAGRPGNREPGPMPASRAGGIPPPPCRRTHAPPRPG